MVTRAASPQAPDAPGDQGDAAGAGLHAHPVQGLGHDGVHVHLLGADQRVTVLEAGELDNLLHEGAQAGGLLAHAPGEVAHQGGVLGPLLQGLGQQGHGADGGLELVGHVGHEVPAHVLQALGGGTVLNEDEDPAAPDGRHPHPEVEAPGPAHPAPGHDNGVVLDPAGGPHTRHHGGDLRLTQGVVAHDIEGVGRRGGAQDLVVVVEDHDRGRQGRQDRQDAVTPAQQGVVRAGGLRVHGGGGANGEPHGHADRGTQEGDDDKQPGVVHAPRLDDGGGWLRGGAAPGPGPAHRQWDTALGTWRGDSPHCECPVPPASPGAAASQGQEPSRA